MRETQVIWHHFLMTIFNMIFHRYIHQNNILVNKAITMKYHRKKLYQTSISTYEMHV